MCVFVPSYLDASLYLRGRIIRDHIGGMSTQEFFFIYTFLLLLAFMFIERRVRLSISFVNSYDSGRYPRSQATTRKIFKSYPIKVQDGKSDKMKRTPKHHATLHKYYFVFRTFYFKYILRTSNDTYSNIVRDKVKNIQNQNQVPSAELGNRGVPIPTDPGNTRCRQINREKITIRIEARQQTQ